MQIFFLLYCAASIAGVAYGTGRHHADLGKEGIKQALRVCCPPPLRLPIPRYPLANPKA